MGFLTSTFTDGLSDWLSWGLNWRVFSQSKNNQRTDLNLTNQTDHLSKLTLESPVVVSSIWIRTKPHLRGIEGDRTIVNDRKSHDRKWRHRKSRQSRDRKSGDSRDRKRTYPEVCTISKLVGPFDRKWRARKRRQTDIIGSVCFFLIFFPNFSQFFLNCFALNCFCC